MLGRPPDGLRLMLVRTAAHSREPVFSSFLPFFYASGEKLPYFLPQSELDCMGRHGAAWDEAPSNRPPSLTTPSRLCLVRGWLGSWLGVLMSLALGHMLVFEDPLTNMPGIPIIAHVLKQNPMPRGIICDRLRFHHSRDLKIPGHALPGLPVETDGNVHGDEFTISFPDTFLALAEFCESWSDLLPNGEAATIETLEGLPLSLWAEAFREMASRGLQ